MGVIIFSTILFNIGTWLGHAFLNRAHPDLAQGCGSSAVAGKLQGN